MNQNSKNFDYSDMNFIISPVCHNEDTNPPLVGMCRINFVESSMIPGMKATHTEIVLKSLERLVEDSKTSLEWSDEEFCWIGPQKELETYWTLLFVFEVIKLWQTITENNDGLGNENKRWSKEQECYLRAAFTTGRSISAMAQDLKRTERAIHSRLNLLGYYVPQFRY